MHFRHQWAQGVLGDKQDTKGTRQAGFSLSFPPGGTAEDMAHSLCGCFALAPLWRSLLSAPLWQGLSQIEPSSPRGPWQPYAVADLLCTPGTPEGRRFGVIKFSFPEMPTCFIPMGLFCYKRGLRNKQLTSINFTENVVLALPFSDFSPNTEIAQPQIRTKH